MSRNVAFQRWLRVGLFVAPAISLTLLFQAAAGVRAAPLPEDRATPSVPPLDTPTPEWTPPEDSQRMGIPGGLFACEAWQITIPVGVPPEGARLHCGAFDPGQAPPAPSGYQLLHHTIHSILYAPNGQWLTEFVVAPTVCLALSAGDRAAVGQGLNVYVVTAPVGGSWTTLTTAVDLGAQRVCAATSQLGLFDLAVGATAAAAPSAPAGGAAGSYRIQPGDTLFQIGWRFNVSVAALRAANGLTGDLIYPEQLLVIPTGWEADTLTLPALIDLPAAPAAAGPTYVVRAGDNLFRIALNHGVRLDDLRAVNGLWSNWIYPGQVLVIP